MTPELPPPNAAPEPSGAYPRLISLAVHEVRTPLGIVAGYLRMLARDAESPLNERHQRLIEHAEKSCERIAAIISELSDVGKLDSGILKIEHQPFDLLSTIHAAAGDVH